MGKNRARSGRAVAMAPVRTYSGSHSRKTQDPPHTHQDSRGPRYHLYIKQLSMGKVFVNQRYIIFGMFFPFVFKFLANKFL